MNKKVLERLQEVLDEMASHMVSVKREDLEQLLKAYEQLKKESDSKN